MKAFWTIVIVFLLIAAVAVTCGGCGQSPLRFAPTEAQRQAAWQTHEIARTIDTVGAEPGSPATRHLTQGTAAAAAYMGLPADPQVEDIDAVLTQASADAAKRPDISDFFDAAEGGFELADAVLVALGLGTVAVGGRGVRNLIRTAKERSQALREVVEANELFQRAEVDAGEKLKAKQDSIQSPATKQIVALERVAVKEKDKLTH